MGDARAQHTKIQGGSTKGDRLCDIDKRQHPPRQIVPIIKKSADVIIVLLANDSI